MRLLEIFLLAMLVSVTVGRGEFYNKCMKYINAFVNCVTVKYVDKD